jgi:hypothetical protein
MVDLLIRLFWGHAFGYVYGYDEWRIRVSTSARKNISGFSIRYDDCRAKSRKRCRFAKMALEILDAIPILARTV